MSVATDLQNATDDAVATLGAQASTIDDLIAKLAACEGSHPPPVVGQRICAWCCGPDLATFLSLEADFVSMFGGYKPRGLTGQYQGTGSASKPALVTGLEPILKNGLPLLDRPGFLYGNQINPRVGQGSSKWPVAYARIAAGEFDRYLIPAFEQIAGLKSKPGRIVLEIPISEANVLHAPPSAQPAVPDPANFPAALAHYLGLIAAAGATNIIPVCSLAGSVWDGPNPAADGYFTNLVVGMLKDAGGAGAADAYSRDGKRTFGSMFTPAYAYLTARDLDLYITETGCAESATDATFKPRFLGEIGTWLPAHPRCRAVFLNHGDSSNGPYRLTTSAATRSAAIALVKAYA